MKIVYVDMDNVLVNFQSGIDKLPRKQFNEFKGKYYEVPNIFSLMDPLEGALDAFKQLSSKYDTYILSTAPWTNTTAWQDKIEWVQKYLGKLAYKRLILSHHKNLNVGDYLIDDRLRNGADKFKGQHIHFGTEEFPDWETILNYLLK